MPVMVKAAAPASAARAREGWITRLLRSEVEGVSVRHRRTSSGHYSDMAAERFDR